MATDGVQNNIGGFQFNAITKADKKTGQINKDTPTQVSIFSVYDSNKDSRVNFKEANSFNLFGQAKIQSDKQGLLKPDEDDNGAGNRAIRLALDKFGDLRSNFENLLKEFNKGYTPAKAPKEEDKPKNARNEIDSNISQEAKQKGTKANDELQSKYDSILKEAYRQALLEANADGKAHSIDDEGNVTAGEANATDTRENDPEIKDYTQTAYSHYDENTDAAIGFKEAVPGGFDVEKYIHTGNPDVEKAIRNDLTALANIETSKDIKTGVKEDVTVKKEKDLNKALAKASKKLDKGVEQATTRRLQDIDRKMKAQVGRIADAKFEGTLDNRQRPISATDKSNGDAKITIVNGNATYAGGTNTTFKPDKKGGGDLATTITKTEPKTGDNKEKQVKYRLTMHIDNDGNVTGQTEFKQDDGVKDETALALGRQVKSDGTDPNAKAVTVDDEGNVTKIGNNNVDNKLKDALGKGIDGLLKFTDNNNYTSEELNAGDYDATKDKGINQNKFNDYKTLGFTALAARVFAQDDSGISLVSYDKSNGKLNDIQVKRQYKNNNDTSETITLTFNDVKALNNWIERAFKDRKNSKKA